MEPEGLGRNIGSHVALYLNGDDERVSRAALIPAKVRATRLRHDCEKQPIALFKCTIVEFPRWIDRVPTRKLALSLHGLSLFC
jgi:hypothetical protein